MTAAEVDRRRVTRRIWWGTWVIALFMVNPLCAGFGVRWYWIFAIELAMIALAGLADAVLRRRQREHERSASSITTSDSSAR